MSNTTSIPCGYVEPNAKSNTQVGCGIYSLSKRSNVPFVEFVGSSGYRKTISWGEYIEVPRGQVVTVGNASYHGGDIFINKGRDGDNRPSRITVPVPFIRTRVQVSEVVEDAWVSKFPCDTRSAKRAYLNIDASASNENGNFLRVFVRGRRLDGSMKCSNPLSQYVTPFGPGVGFLGELDFPNNTQLSYIPLGQGAIATDDTRPHNLLDAGDVFMVIGTVGASLTNIMSWDYENIDPGTWFVIEYD